MQLTRANLYCLNITFETICFKLSNKTLTKHESRRRLQPKKSLTWEDVGPYGVPFATKGQSELWGFFWQVTETDHRLLRGSCVKWRISQTMCPNSDVHYLSPVPRVDFHYWKYWKANGIREPWKSVNCLRVNDPPHCPLLSPHRPAQMSEMFVKAPPQVMFWMAMYPLNVEVK